MTFDFFEFNVAGAYLSALINGDYSGLDDEEEALFNEFLSTVDARVTHWDCGDEPRFTTDDVSGLRADCYECRAYFPA